MTRLAGYAERARYYAAEISHVPEPSLLKGLLTPALAVAEMPSGTGHFLPAYAASGARITLADACPEMLEAAQKQIGCCGANITTICGLIEDLSNWAGSFDLIVTPNGALNQLAATTSLSTVLASIARLLRPGGLLLFQLLDPVIACGFYDPGVADDCWILDQTLRAGDGTTISRRRRQHHHDDEVTIDFEIRCGDHAIHDQQVTLRLLTDRDLRAEIAQAGLRTAKTIHGSGGLTELLCSRPHTDEP